MIVILAITEIIVITTAISIALVSLIVALATYLIVRQKKKIRTRAVNAAMADLIKSPILKEHNKQTTEFVECESQEANTVKNDMANSTKDTASRKDTSEYGEISEHQHLAHSSIEKMREKTEAQHRKHETQHHKHTEKMRLIKTPKNDYFLPEKKIRDAKKITKSIPANKLQKKHILNVQSGQKNFDLRKKKVFKSKTKHAIDSPEEEKYKNPNIDPCIQIKDHNKIYLSTQIDQIPKYELTQILDEQLDHGDSNKFKIHDAEIKIHEEKIEMPEKDSRKEEILDKNPLAREKNPAAKKEGADDDYLLNFEQRYSLYDDDETTNTYYWWDEDLYSVLSENELDDYYLGSGKNWYEDSLSMDDYQFDIESKMEPIYYRDYKEIAQSSTNYYAIEFLSKTENNQTPEENKSNAVRPMSLPEISFSADNETDQSKAEADINFSHNDHIGCEKSQFFADSDQLLMQRDQTPEISSSAKLLSIDLRPQIIVPEAMFEVAAPYCDENKSSIEYCDKLLKQDEQSSNYLSDKNHAITEVKNMGSSQKKDMGDLKSEVTESHFKIGKNKYKKIDLDSEKKKCSGDKIKN